VELVSGFSNEDDIGNDNDNSGEYLQLYGAPPNFRLFPIDAYDEDELRSSYLANKKGFGQWLAQIKTWYEVGI
jgi:hypothetical protein